MATSVPGLTLSRRGFADAFAPEPFLRALLDFEVALAQAQAAEGVIPAAAAEAIERARASLRFDVETLLAEGRRAASVAVPLVAALRAVVPASVSAQVHFGATSQDAVDTAMALCLKPCLEEADRTIGAAIRALARRAREHRATPMLGRTLMQAAVPMTAGLKIARWAAALAQDRDRLLEAQAIGLAVQLGGPVGALEALGEHGPAVRHRMALRLGIADVRAWHVHRNAWLDLLGRAGHVVLTTGKIALDVALLSQPEVAEMREADEAAGGRSSAMPHKRNPTACARARAAAARVPGQLATLHAGALSEHERALGAWQAELATVPELTESLGSALDFLETIGSSLRIDADRMRANLAAHGGGLPHPGMATATDEILAELASFS